MDVVAYQDGNLKNLSLDETGVSREMLDRYVDLELPTSTGTVCWSCYPSPSAQRRGHLRL